MNLTPRHLTSTLSVSQGTYKLAATDFDATFKPNYKKTLSLRKDVRE